MPREALLRDLKALGPRELRQVLKPFSPAERDAVLKLVGLANGPDTRPPPFDVLASLSPWLLRSIGQQPGDGPQTASSITPAARLAVSEALHSLAKLEGPKSSARGRRFERLLQLRPVRALKALSR